MTTANTVNTARRTEAMRARADQLNAGVREANRDLHARAREAAQLVHEAGLLDAAADARAEADGARSRLPRLEGAVTKAVAAERSAEDRHRAQEAHLTRARAERQKGAAELADAPRQVELAIAVHTCEEVVASYAAVLATARREREQAETERDEWAAYVAELEAEAVAAEHAAANPGPAPNAPGLAPGVSGISDLDADAKNLVLAAVLLTAKLDGRTQAPVRRGQPGRIGGPISRTETRASSGRCGCTTRRALSLRRPTDERPSGASKSRATPPLCGPESKATGHKASRRHTPS